MPAHRLTDNLFELKGTAPDSRRRHDTVPEFTGGRPQTPAHLSDESRKHFKKLVSLLCKRGTITRLDGIALEVLVSQYERLRAAQAELKGEYFIDVPVPDGNGGFVYKRAANPALAVIEKAEGLIRQQLAQLGLSPASRAPKQSTKEGKKKSTAPRPGSVAAMIAAGENNAE